ncbi:reverse transcriptase domain-containing protein [Tanacetum coccineum]
MKVPIVFPPLSVEDVSDEPLIIEVVMEGYMVRRVYVDQGASLKVMFEHCFENLSPAMRSRLRSTQMEVGFVRGVVKPLGKIELEETRFKSSPNGFLNNTLHDKVSHSKRDRNFGHSDNGHCRVPEAREEAIDRKETCQNTLWEKEGQKRVGLTEQALVNPAYPDHLVIIGGNLMEGCKDKLKALLKKSMDIFATRCAKKKSYGIRQNQAVVKEVGEWMNAGIVRPVKHPTWISNSMLVKKATEAGGCAEMALDDKEKTAFYMDHGTYCYTKISFGLKNAGVTYQRLVDTAFQSHIRRNLKAYADDMVIKSNDEKVLIADIAETLLSRSAKKSLPFFETLKDITKENKDEYRWTENAKKAFQEIKKFIVELSLLTAPVKEETLYVYLAAATEAVSAVLLIERKGKQCLIHYVSRTLNKAKRNYALVEK